MQVLIVGGGIGGLTTALSLHAAGIDCCIYESVISLRALGVGINLQPNAVRELTELGLGEALAETAIETSTLAYYNKHGQLIWSEPRGRAAGYRWPQYSIHRGELLIILLAAVRARLGAERIHTGHHFAGFEQDQFGVTARFTRRADGTSVTAHADVLVGADGIHSAVRAQLYPHEGKPVFSGLIEWRGAVEAEPFLDGRTQVMIGHHDQRSVVYPISAKSQRRGRSLVNWLTLLAERREDAERENWDQRVGKERFFEPFKHWNFPWLPLADLISSTAEIFEYPMCDRDPLPAWTFGRVTLLGDAAHPMRPVGSQAGSQGVVDARVLAHALAGAADPTRGLLDYETIRRPAMNEVVLRNRQYGPEIVMQIAEERAPGGFSNIEDIIPRRELEDVSLSFKKAAGFDPETVNTRPSYNVGSVVPS
jgi:2-polyprenyl-6-methoxyphenol hydroxylase-like FAD-dependent oxidoreductase